MTRPPNRRYCPTCGRWTATLEHYEKDGAPYLRMRFRPGTTKVWRSSVPPRYSYQCDACHAAEDGDE